MAVLDGLDAVPWHQLHHAYGPAVDVPGLLRALVAPEQAADKLQQAAKRASRSVREQAIWTLWGNVFHQGTVWQASPHVVPFLVEILREGPRDPTLRRFVIDYLHHLALGYPTDVFPTVIDPVSTYARADDAPANARDPLDEVRMIGFARDCYRGAVAALPAIAACVHDDDEPTAVAAIAMLGSFREPACAPALGDVLARAAPTTARFATALVALAQLDPARTRDLALRHLAAPDPRLAIHAAVALVLVDPDGAPDAAIARLAAPGELAAAPTPLTFTLGALVSRTLARVPGRHRAVALEAIATVLATSDPTTNLSATSNLLAIAFDGAAAPPHARELLAHQRRALEAIAAHGAFVIGEATYGNYALLLAEWQLPTTADALRAWLAER